MEYRTLGNTNLKVPIIAFGCSPFGDVFGTADEQECIRAAHLAIDHGLNYFDVAPLYGFTLAEERLGKALNGKRNDVIVATKCCRDTFSRMDYSGKRVLQSIDESLRRLKTDHVDILQIHDVEFGPRRQVIEEAIPAARMAQRAGKCRYVGITGLPVRYLRSLIEGADVDTVLSWGHYNLVEDELDEEVAPICAERGIGLINASPLHQRLLTSSPPPEWHRSPKPVLEVVPQIERVCREFGVDIADVAMRYAIDYPKAATTIVGMSKAQHVQANLKVLDFRIPDGLLERIRQVAEPIMNMMWFEGLPENNIPPSDPRRYVPRVPDHTHDD